MRGCESPKDENHYADSNKEAAHVDHNNEVVGEQLSAERSTDTHESDSDVDFENMELMTEEELWEAIERRWNRMMARARQYDWDKALGKKWRFYR